MTTFEYGAMSSLYSCEAENKLTAYVIMCMHYGRNNHMIAIYSPLECKQDMWLSLDGKVSRRLDEIFGGVDSFDKYIEDHIDEIKACYKTIKQLK
jgi:hypothetical protein